MKKNALHLSFCIATMLVVSYAKAATIELVASLDGEQEVPLVETTGTGTAVLAFDDVSKVLAWEVHFTRLSGVATAAHFHGPAAAGTTAGIQVGIGGSGDIDSPLTGSATLSPSQEQALLAGQWYLNLHTAANPDGEIRGQAEPIVTIVAPLTGDQVVPPVAASATGVAQVIYNVADNRLQWQAAVFGTGELTEPHLHGPAPPGQNAPVQVTFPSTTISGQQERDLLDGLWYFDIHTASQPGGLVRGQLSLSNPLEATKLVAAVLPASRSVQVDSTATAFATIINGGNRTALGCSIVPVSEVAAEFLYQETDPVMNALVGEPQPLVDIPAGASKSFLFALTPNAAFSPSDIVLGFDCANSPVVGTLKGVNTLLLSASVDPVPDIVALAAVPREVNDGIADIPAVGGTGFFVVATVNVGSAGRVSAVADTGSATLPLNLSLCETDPLSSICKSPPVAGGVTLDIPSDATPTFAVFITATDVVAFDPGVNRVFLRFKDDAGVVRGATSVAVQTL